MSFYRRRKRKPKAVQVEAFQRYRDVVKRADKLWSMLVLSRGMCQRCRVKPAVHPHHLVSRRYHATRWDLVNGAALCAGCHHLVTIDSHENGLLALSLVGSALWEWLNVAKRELKTDPSLALVAMEAEAKRLVLKKEAKRG